MKLEVRSDEVRSNEVRSLEVRSLEVRSNEVRSLEVRSNAVRSMEVRSIEVRSPSRASIRLSMVNICGDLFQDPSSVSKVMERTGFVRDIHSKTNVFPLY